MIRCVRCGDEIRALPRCGMLQCRLAECLPARWAHWTEPWIRDHSAESA